MLLSRVRLHSSWLTLLGLGCSKPSARRAARARAGDCHKKTVRSIKRGCAVLKRDFSCRSQAISTTHTAAVSSPGNTTGTSVSTVARFLCPQNIALLACARNVFRLCGAASCPESSLFSRCPKWSFLTITKTVSKSPRGNRRLLYFSKKTPRKPAAWKAFRVGAFSTQTFQHHQRHPQSTRSTGCAGVNRRKSQGR